jgi:hypothetical protein
VVSRRRQPVDGKKAGKLYLPAVQRWGADHLNLPLQKRLDERRGSQQCQQRRQRAVEDLLPCRQRDLALTLLIGRKTGYNSYKDILRAIRLQRSIPGR